MFIISGGDLLYYELRSGTFNLTHDVFGLSLSGVLSGGGAYDWLSVRPALHSKNAYNLRANAWYHLAALRQQQ